MKQPGPFRAKPRVVIPLSFLAAIAAGTLLLLLPASTAEGAHTDFVTALFTATTSVCVTGLTVVDVGTEFSRTGLVVLTTLVEIGCLGLMTCGTFLMIAIGRRLSLHREFTLKTAYGVPAVKGLRGLIVWVVGSMLAIQVAGTLALYPQCGDWFQASFYSMMNFCNAGFSYLPGSLAAWEGKPVAVMIMAALTVVGGIGFLVHFNLCTFKFM